RIVKRDGRSGAVSEIREIAGPPGIDGHGGGSAGSVSRSNTLLAKEEERSILAVIEPGDHNRAARGAAKLVALERSPRSAVPVVAPGVGVQLAVPEKFEKRDMQGVGSGAGGHVDDASAGPAVLGRQCVGDDGELFDAIHDGRVA